MKKKTTERINTTKALRKKYKGLLKRIPADSQNYKVLAYILENGSITPKEAEKKPIGSMRLSARVWDLKHRYNVPIQKQLLMVKRNGKVTPYANYYIKDIKEA